MEPWILLSVAAAAFQTLRFALQKRLSMGPLSAGGATLARFAYAAPFAAALAALYAALAGGGAPGWTPRFWGFALAGGLAQIGATWCVVALFAARNFAVGITFKKTEVLLTALVGFAVLGDRLGVPALLAIALGVAGVWLLSQPAVRTGAARWGVFNRAAGLGLASGLLFAISAVGYRGATLEILSPDPVMRALMTLAVVTCAQTLALGLWLARREPGQLAAIWGARTRAVWMGLASLGGSLCWFTAFTLQNAALVFAVGQVEVVFSLAVAALAFGERVTTREGAGIALVTLSVIAVAMLR